MTETPNDRRTVLAVEISRWSLCNEIKALLKCLLVSMLRAELYAISLRIESCKSTFREVHFSSTSDVGILSCSDDGDPSLLSKSSRVRANICRVGARARLRSPIGTGLGYDVTLSRN